jgi:hypothetical protein
MSLSLEKLRLVAPDNVITRAVDGTLVILDIDTGRSFTLDAVGARVWTLLTSTASAQETYEVLLTEFRADPEQLRADVELMIQQLTADALLTIERV